MKTELKMVRENTEFLRVFYDIELGEFEIVEYISEGLTYEEIAKIWGTRSSTAEEIKGQVKKIKEKINRKRPHTLPRISSNIQLLRVLGMIL